MKKRFAAFVLALVMLVGMTACSKDDTTKPQKPDVQQEETQAELPKYAYKATYITLDTGEEPLNWIRDYCVSGNTVYYYGDAIIGQEAWVDEATGETMIDEMTGEPYMQDVYETRIYAMDLTTGVSKRLPGFVMPELPEGKLGGININGMYTGADGTLWINQQTNTYYYDVPENFDPANDSVYNYYVEDGNKTELIQLDSTGAVVKTIELEMPETGYLYNLALGSDGSIVASDWENVLFYDADGKIKTQVKVEGSINTMFDLGEGNVCVSTYREDGNYLIEVDQATATLGEPQKMVNNAYYLYPGFDEYAYLYEYGSSILGYNAATDTSEKVLSWIDCDVDSSNFYGLLKILPDGRVFNLESIYENEYESNTVTYNIIMLEQIDPASVPVREQLTLACFYLDWDLRSQIVNFNRSQDKVRITVNEYEQYATEDNYEAGIQKLNTEIMSGVVPDLLLINSNMPVEQYIAKGILTDLWPLIDGDAELSRDDLMTHFFEALSVDGKLYEITDSFYIDTAVGKESVVGSGESWTMEEFMTVLNQQPEGTAIFGSYDTKQSILDNSVARNAETFINWNTLQCSFDTPEFIDMLTFANRFPMEIDYSAMNGDYAVMPVEQESEAQLLRTGKQLLFRTGIYSFDGYQYADLVFGEKASFIGYPSASGNGSTFGMNRSFAISASCKNVDAAWQFLRTYLTEEHQTKEYMYEFPTNKHSFEVLAERSMTPSYYIDENGEEVESANGSIWYGDNDNVEYYAMTQAQYDGFMALYEKTNSFSSYNNEINALIREETEAFFNGQKTAEETAKLIQDRVTLYVFENS